MLHSYYNIGLNGGARISSGKVLNIFHDVAIYNQLKRFNHHFFCRDGQARTNRQVETFELCRSTCEMVVDQNGKILLHIEPHDAEKEQLHHPNHSALKWTPSLIVMDRKEICFQRRIERIERKEVPDFKTVEIKRSGRAKTSEQFEFDGCKFSHVIEWRCHKRHGGNKKCGFYNVDVNGDKCKVKKQKATIWSDVQKIETNCINVFVRFGECVITKVDKWICSLCHTYKKQCRRQVYPFGFDGKTCKVPLHYEKTTKKTTKISQFFGQSSTAQSDTSNMDVDEDGETGKNVVDDDDDEEMV